MKNIAFLLAIIFSVNQTFSQQKNVVVFLVDDLGYHDLSSKGSNFYETPNIDKLAAQGIDFENAYVSHPRCLPSRYGLITSKIPGSNGVPGGKNVGLIMDNDTTIGEAFQQNGYETFFAGKWHLGKTAEHWPQNRGFDINIAGGAAGAPKSYFWPYNTGTWVEDNGLKTNNKNKGHGKILGLEKGGDGEYLTDRLTAETVNFISQKHDKPFFAILAHYGVHTPLEAPEELVKKYQEKLKSLTFNGDTMKNKDGETKQFQDQAVYAAMIESIDNSLGEIVKSLKDNNLYDNTIIVFTSDHGGLSNRGLGNKRILATSNLPLRAGKGHIYEGGIKVPLILGGAFTSKSHKSYQVTSNIDLKPTLLELCNLKTPKEEIDGVSIAKSIKSNTTFKRTLIWHSPRARKISTGDNYCTVIRIGDYKLFDFYKDDIIELYDLSKDPYEANNIAESNEELVRSLKKKINDWKNKVNAIE